MLNEFHWITKGGQVIDESQYSNVVTVKILQGASV
jgi:hypothetical protein